jgi:protein-tyrosine phosphatase
MDRQFSIVDIHAHLLPGLDDGPRTIADALRMCELYVAQGVTTVVATPHMCDRRYKVTVDAVRSGVEELRVACSKRGLNLQILPGGDVRLEPELLDAWDKGELLTLADRGKYLLLELPLQRAPRIDGLIFQLSLRGITAILSHPERNIELWRKPQRLAELVDRSCLVQITAASLFGSFGPAPKETAERFLKAGLVHVVASDAHSPGGRKPELRRAAELLSSTLGENKARELLWTNPAAIIQGELREAPTRSRVGQGGQRVTRGRSGGT